MLLATEVAPSLISYRLSLSFRAHGHSGVVEDLLAPSHCVFLIVTWNSFLCMSTVSLKNYCALCSVISCSWAPHAVGCIFMHTHTMSFTSVCPTALPGLF